MRTMSTTGAARPARVISTPKCLISRLRHDERGVLDIELIGFVPILVLVPMCLVPCLSALSGGCADGRPRGCAVVPPDD